MAMGRVILNLQSRPCGSWSWTILMNFPNCWLCSFVASVLSENILLLKIFLEVPSPLVTSGAIIVCIFFWPLCYSKGLQCMLWLIIPTGMIFLGTLKNYALAKLTLSRSRKRKEDSIHLSLLSNWPVIPVGAMAVVAIGTPKLNTVWVTSELASG